MTPLRIRVGEDDTYGTDADPWKLPDGSPLGPKYHVRTLREFVGLTQKEFAAKLDVQPQAVVRWEAGSSTPEQPRVRAMMQLLLDHMAQRANELAGRGGEHVNPEALARVLASASAVILRGGRAALTADQWSGLLGIGETLLAELPRVDTKEPARYWGYDVGHRLDAAVRGLTYSQHINSPAERLYRAPMGAERIENEMWLHLSRIDRQIELLAYVPPSKPTQPKRHKHK